MTSAYVLTFARLPVCDGLGGVPVVTLLTVMAVPASSEVATLQTHASTHATRQFVQLHVKAAAPGM